jgi:hypothetical protein
VSFRTSGFTLPLVRSVCLKRPGNRGGLQEFDPVWALP